MRLLLGIAIGVVGTYLYFNPGQQDEVIATIKDGVNKGATIVQEITD